MFHCFDLKTDKKGNNFIHTYITQDSQKALFYKQTSVSTVSVFFETVFNLSVLPLDEF